MKHKDYLRAVLILAIFFLALGGWLLHMRIHPLAKDAENYIPFVAGLLSVTIVPILFTFRPSIPFAYLLNGMLVIIGTIAMVHFSLANPPPVWTVKTIFTGTLLADVALLWGKFAVGKALFELEAAMQHPDLPMRSGRFFRFPNMGFWFSHIIALTVFYIIGGYIW